MNQPAIELLKPVIGPVVALLLAWAVGNRLSANWVTRQKRRDDAREAANQFYRLYGEFFAVWKLWNYSLKHPDDAEKSTRRWELLNRAASAEAGVEAFLVKLSAERELATGDVEVLGKFRQGFQALRQVIRDGKPLDWSSADHPEYAAFKRLASHAARLVSTVDKGGVPSTDAAYQAFRAITTNAWEGRWHHGGAGGA